MQKIGKKVGNRKKLEIGKGRKLEKIGNQIKIGNKKQEIEKKQKVNKGGN